MDDVEHIIKHAEKHCKARGSRLTPKRKQVLSGLLRSQKALSAYELMDVCQNEFGETVAAMSMYRILDFLRHEELVHKLNLANKYIACAHITCDQEHAVPQFLICSECQKVEEVSISPATIEGLQQNVEDAGFQLLSPQLEMHCVCNHCMTKK